MPPWTGIDATYCGLASPGPTPFTSDYVFCDQPIIHFWQVSLYLALLFWGLLTVANLVPLFHNGTHEQTIAGEVLRQLLLQMGLLILVACSFYLLQVINQGESYLIDALANTDARPGSYQNCVDCLWTGSINTMIQDVYGRVQNQGSDDIFQSLSGGQWTFAPTNSPQAGLFGQSWGQIIGGVATFASTFTTLGPTVRYVVMVLTLGSAPFALMAAGHRFTRPLFSLWLHLWGELVVLAFLSALVVAGWTAIIESGSPADSTSDAYIGLAALGLLGGMNLAYIMRIMGNFIQTTSGFYQANYQRVSNTIVGAAKLGAALVGTAVGLGVAAGAGGAGEGAATAELANAGTGGTTVGGAGTLTPGGGGPGPGLPGNAGAATIPPSTPSGAASLPGGAAGSAGGVSLSTPSPDSWREWSASGAGGATTSLGTGTATAAALTRARATSTTPLPGRSLPPAPTGRTRGIATVMASSGFPLFSDFSRPLATGLNYAHQAEQEQESNRRYAFSLSESVRKEQIATERYNESQAKSDHRYAVSATYSLQRQKDATLRDEERKAEATQQRAASAAYSLQRQKDATLRDEERKAEATQQRAVSAAYGLFRQKEAALRDDERKAESAQRYANTAAYGLLRQKEGALREAERKAEKEARSQTYESF